MKIFRILIGLLFPIMILLTSTLVMSANQGFYTYQYEKNNIYEVTGISRQDMPEVIDRLSGYVVGRYKSLNHKVKIHGQEEWIYGEREILHMEDVKRIFDVIRINLVLYGVSLLGVGYQAFKKKKLATWCVELASFGLYGSSILLGGIGLLVTMDFSKYFVVFHELFFTNDLWLLDPKTDVLIQMLPQSFFMEIAIVIIALSLSVSIICFTVSKAVRKRVTQKRR